jgi:AcrR family transcriptional regulator
VNTRARQRATTRAAIIDAASAAFLESGFAGTTIAVVARRAEVSQESVYLIFRNKRELFLAVVEAVATGHDGAAVVDEGWLADARAEPDQRRRLAIMAHATRDVLRRIAPLDEVARAAAVSDPEIAALWRSREDARRRDARVLVELLAEAGPLRMSIDDATDLMWALSRSTDLYRALTVDRDWDDQKAFGALEDLLARALLGD